MTVSLEQFVKQLEESGVIASETLKDYLPPKNSPKDAEDLARELIRQKQLTKFQAEELWRGKGKSLVLGNYVLLEKIGAGGMGQVFKAEHLRMHRIVALKVLPAKMTKDSAAVARFEREATAAARLNHPNIIAAYDADLAGRVHFLVMEWVDGTDLSALVKQDGPLPVEKALNYIQQAAYGLGAAHAAGMVHRDIKPSNLLLDKKGVVKILDMGLVRIHGGAENQAELTASGAILGTIDYIAPEQALNTKTADARADVYSLGCTLFYLLTGRATYGGDSLMAKLLAHREQPIPSLRAVRPEVPDPVDAIFRKMVAKRIEDRYQSIAEVLSDLQRLGAAPVQSIDPQSSFDSSTSGGLTDFLTDISISSASPAPVRKRASAKHSKQKQLLLKWGARAAAVGIVVACLIFMLRPKSGTLVVKIDEPEAEVLIINEAGKVESTRNAGQGTVSIPLAPGWHELHVTKDGFRPFVGEFTLKPGGKALIRVRMLPASETETESQADAEDAPADLSLLLPSVDDADRRAAKWVLSKGGEVRVSVNGGSSVGLAVVSSLPTEAFQLIEVSLKGTKVSNGDLGYLSGLKRLRTLSLENTKISAKGLINLPVNEDLQELNLVSTRVDDKDLPLLYGMEKLKLIRLTGSKVTPKGVAALRKALPKCKVLWFDWGL